MKIQLLNKIAQVGTDLFDKDWEVSADVKNPDAIMVRSTAMHDMEFGDNLKAIARAGAGVNNIPLDRCAEKGIVVFNTPGANANGVKELTLAALFLASRKIVDGVNWSRTLDGAENGVAKSVEKGKSKFAGCEIKGKVLGVIGLGAIGGMVANAASVLGMKVVGCDPYLSVNAAWSIDSHVTKANSFDDIYACADYITLHVPATSETKGMINAESIAKMKDGVKIINLARADLVDAAALKSAIESGKVSAYVTDFPTEETINVNGIITIPHLGASTEESEDNCAVMAANELIDYLENGNITNSVNYPSASMPRSGKTRICMMHKNIPSILAQISAVISGEGINIENMINKSRGDYAYTILDVGEDVGENSLSKISTIEGMTKVNTYR
mgnify:CR=1 FL=1